MLEESLRMQFGPFVKILEQGSNIRKIVFLNNCAQFRMDEEAQVSLLTPKHKQDDWRDSRRGDVPILRPVFEGAELKL